MRRNKFVNPLDRKIESSFWNQSPNKINKNIPLVQNKIYFPTSLEDKLSPYKFQLSYQKNAHNSQKMHSSELYEIKQTEVDEQRKKQKSNFKRQTKFDKIQSLSTINDSSKLFIKYSTLELKNLPGINFTTSGTTIYRSKNIKSLRKLIFQRSLNKGKSQIKRNLSFQNEESPRRKIQKSTSNRQTGLKIKQGNTIIYDSYFPSKPLNKGNISSSDENDSSNNQKEKKIVENPEDILCRFLIKAQLYQDFDLEETQQFF